MDTVQAHIAQYRKLINSYETITNQVRADGVIDYGESLNMREFLEEFRVQMTALKTQVTTEMTGLRERYRLKGEALKAQHGDTAPAAEMLKIRSEYRDTFEMYQKLVEQLDFWMVAIPEAQQHTLKLIADHEAGMNAVFDGFEAVVFDEDTLEQPPVKAELKRVVNGWQNLLKNLASNAADSSRPQQQAYDTGVRRALELAIADIHRVIKTLE